jgi:hypothetical protein
MVLEQAISATVIRDTAETLELEGMEGPGIGIDALAYSYLQFRRSRTRCFIVLCLYWHYLVLPNPAVLYTNVNYLMANGNKAPCSAASAYIGIM